LAILCGVDIVEINRIEKSFEKLGDSFRDRVFTQVEIEYCEAKRAARYQSYAARFAAKEAVSKAFGTGIGNRIGWKNIEVINDVNGKPNISLTQTAKEMLNEINAKSISLSLSHCDHYAVAYVVIQTE